MKRFIKARPGRTAGHPRQNTRFRYPAVLLLFVAGITSGQAGPRLNAGLGYFSDSAIHPGVIAVLELERHAGETHSVPTTLTVGSHRVPEYYAISAILQSGIRVDIGRRFFAEQSLGIGVHANLFTVDSIWYVSRGSGFRYADGFGNLGWGPAASVAGGMYLGDGDRRSMLWVRPLVYWNLGIRPLHLPYAAVQLGFHTTIGRL